ncbi:hypothetical protein VTN77DRAFT_7212 [Rasamsonia byssochlamydoides]|uniref:uncharacterized protein n=1 Tax=Rasamsonia byssochlamydoides TaxID=89139 RepID=UPI0037435527
MESPFMSSPLSSPDITAMPVPFPAFYDLNSDSSNPSSPIVGVTLFRTRRATCIFYRSLTSSQQNNKSLLFPVTSLSYNVPLYEGGPMELYTPLKEKMPIATDTVEGQNRRRKSNPVKDPETIVNMQFRRRAQNRASQHAFRERKERHLKNVESQLQNLQGLHHDLLQSYNQQAQEVSRLKERIQELMSEIEKLRNDNASDSQSFDLPATFDMIPYPSMTYTYTGPESSLSRNMKINTQVEFHKGSDDTL